MKTSELIARLAEILAAHGDVEVFTNEDTAYGVVSEVLWHDELDALIAPVPAALLYIDVVVDDDNPFKGT